MSFVSANGRRTLATVVLVAVGATLGSAVTPPAATHAVIVSIDGLRPDLIDAALTPHLNTLMRLGSYSRSAQTAAEGYTLPSHLSMLTGVSPAKHGVTWNRHIEGAYAAVPTIFGVARAARLTTAVFAGKTKMIVLNRPGDLTWSFIGFEGRDTDADVATRAVEALERHRPALTFVHLGDVDLAGHKSGWGSAAQRAAIARADDALGRLWRAIEPFRRTTFFLVTADHGGQGTRHDPALPSSRRIPWIAVGPMVRSNVDLGAAGIDVDTRDTFATVCAALGLTLPAGVEGRPVPIAP